MRYQCLNCYESFEGKLNYCPHCGIKLSWVDSSSFCNSNSRNLRRLAILKQLNLIKALYCCYRVNSLILQNLEQELSLPENRLGYTFVTGFSTDFVFKTDFDFNSEIKYKEYKEKELFVQNLYSKKEKYREYSLIAKEAFEKVLNTSEIHPKYRNILSICQFIDYLDTNRCWELVGPEGCYDKYEKELIQNKIVSRLDDIENHLQQIESNQQTLDKMLKNIDVNSRSIISVVRNVENKVGEVNENLEAINSCQKIIASYSEESASNTEQIIKDLAYYYYHFS